MDNKIKSARVSDVEHTESDLSFLVDCVTNHPHPEFSGLCSEQGLRDIYTYLRDTYFRTTLDIPPIDDVYLSWSNRLKSCVGKCETRTIRDTVPNKYSHWIRLAMGYHREYPFDIMDTLAHEMIHLKITNHPPKFKDILYELQDKGLRVFMHSQDRGEVTSQRKKRRREKKERKEKQKEKANYALVCPYCQEVYLYIRESKNVREVKRFGDMRHGDLQNKSNWRSCRDWLSFYKVEDGKLLNESNGVEYQINNLTVKLP
jgi:uncharacterized protein YbaR (Trm112 family)